MATIFRKSMKIMPGLRLNFNKTGVSASVGSNGFYSTKKVMSYSDPANPPASSGGFNFKAAIGAFIGLGLLFSPDSPWWLMIFGAFMGFPALCIFLMDTAANPAWLWIFPVLAGLALYHSFDAMAWWQSIGCLMVIFLALFRIAYVFIPATCVNCNQKVHRNTESLCPHCNQPWHIKAPAPQNG